MDEYAQNSEWDEYVVKTRELSNGTWYCRIIRYGTARIIARGYGLTKWSAIEHAIATLSLESDA